MEPTSENIFARSAARSFRWMIITVAIALQLVCSSASACEPVTISVSLATKNTDGTSLTNAIGQRLYYGQDPQNLSNKIDFGLVTTVQTPCLDDGKWYFAATTLTATEESARNSGASKVVSTTPPPAKTELCFVEGSTSGTRPVYAVSSSGTRGAKISDLAVGPAAQAAGTPNPVSRAQCSCSNLKIWGGTTYSAVAGGYVSGCRSFGLQ